MGALAALIFAPHGKRLWITAGIGYAGALLLAPMLLRADDADGVSCLVLLFAVVWTPICCGFFAGRAFGGPKLMPAISPNKTWSGAVAGALGAMIVAARGGESLWTVRRVAIASSPAALGGGATRRSLGIRVKRQFGVKDASQLIPGHGGVMDRLDGFWAAALSVA